MRAETTIRLTEYDTTVVLYHESPKD